MTTLETFIVLLLQTQLNPFFSQTNQPINTMEPFGIKAIILATIFSSFLSLRAYKRKSLTSVGSIAAFAVAFLLVGSGLRGFNLFTFYFISIKATKYKVRAKYFVFCVGTVWIFSDTTIFLFLASHYRKKSKLPLTEPSLPMTGAQLGARARSWRVLWWPPYSAWPMPIFAEPRALSRTVAKLFCRPN